ncbi:hypothetical protein FE236_07185 [Mariprofundus erugo]|uniref:hypothetical protein n=1 Tax=Mariprofundus erugo TaxID=2528639 RepID=UPI0010FD2001|nr:hypothetical protein [Mariprofundus erugo]TLS76404.1 hypothetical protein FE236_07185 [Mariprofundus erugo]
MRCFNRLVRLLAASLILASLLNSCGNHDKSDISTILDARDRAVSEHDILAYHELLAPGYQDRGETEAALVIRINKLFEQFDEITMTSDNRIIRLQDENHALCEQNYRLRVRADKSWREMYQREQISLTRTPAGWRISGGL